MNFKPEYFSLLILSVIYLFITDNVMASKLVGNPELGERIYSQGILESGKPVKATTQGDIVFTGAQMSCTSCHRRSGYGSSEGGIYVLPITGPTLFNPRNLDRANLLKKMFKESQPSKFWARMRSPRIRSAYNNTSLAKAIRTGIDPSGRQLMPLMPEYDMPDQDMANLTAYLKTLSSKQDPGVDKEKIYFATIVTDKTAPEKRQAMLATMDKFVEWMNLDTKGDKHHPNFSPNYRSELIKAYRLWQLDVWELHGEADTWGKQLEKYYNERPVFAVIGGIVPDSWESVQIFCENIKLPCLFPQTELPVTDKTFNYSFHFSRGLALEADVVAEHIISANKHSVAATQVIQLSASTDSGKVPADIINKRLKKEHNTLLSQLRFSDKQSLIKQLSQISVQQTKIDTLIIWPGNYGTEVLAWLVQHPNIANNIYLPSNCLEDISTTLPVALREKLLFSYPYEVPGGYHPRAFRVRGWMRTRQLDIKYPRLQFNTYYALTLVQYGLDAIVDNFSRDYLMEYVEHEAENALNPGTYPHLSLGPGQRFASKGAYIVKRDPIKKKNISPVSMWIIPN